MQNEVLQQVKNFFFDLDGVLTNGNLLVLPNGLQARQMHVKDGYALQLAVKKGYHVAVISGGNAVEVITRLEKLGINAAFFDVKNKADFLRKYFADNRLQPSESLFMGDDIPDLQPMLLCGFSCCPADAVPEIKAVATYVSPLKGGEACVREIIEMVLKAQNNWSDIAGTASK